MQKLLIFLMVSALLVLAITPVTGNQDEALKIYETYGCRECHAILALDIGVAEVAAASEEEDDGWGDDDEEAIAPPDLSNVGKVRDAHWISKWLRKKVDNDGIMHKKRFQGSKEERKMLALWLETLKYDVPEGVGVVVPAVEGEQTKP